MYIILCLCYAERKKSGTLSITTFSNRFETLQVSLEELAMHVQILDQSSQANSNKESVFSYYWFVLFISYYFINFFFVLRFRFEIARCFMS